VEDLYTFRDRFFETHPIEKASDKSEIVKKRMRETIEQFDQLSGIINKYKNKL
jgi:hypothetical protein